MKAPQKEANGTGSSYSDEAGNRWEWDGEEYVSPDANGLKWIYEGDQWMVKGDDGHHYINHDDQWLVVGEGGNLFEKQQDGTLVPVKGKQPLQLPPSPGAKLDALLPKHRAAHKCRRHRKRPREHITVHAELPAQTQSPLRVSPQNAVEPNNPKIVVMKPQAAEIIRLGGPMGNTYSTVHPCPVHSMHHTGMRGCDQHGENTNNQNSEFGIIKSAWKKVTDVFDTKQKQESVYSSHSSHVPSSFHSQEQHTHSQSVTNQIASEEISNITSSHMSNTGTRSNIFTDNEPDNLIEKYRNMAEMMTNTERDLTVRMNQLNKCVGLIEKLSVQSPRSPADDLLLSMARTMQSVLKENIYLEQTKNGNKQNQLWSPQEAFKMDALISEARGVLTDVTHILKTVESSCYALNDEIVDCVRCPETRSVLKITSESQNFHRMLNSAVASIFEVTAEVERLLDETKAAQSKAALIAAKNPDCACRPSVHLLEDEKHTLSVKLSETHEELKQAKEKLIISDIRQVRLKKKSEIFEAQIKAITKLGAPNAETIKYINQGTAYMEDESKDLELRIKKLESVLHTYKANAAPAQLHPAETLSAKLFAMSEDDKRLLEERKGAIVRTPYAAFTPPPLRTMPVVLPPNLPPVELRLTGDETGAVNKLAGVLENLVALKENPRVATSNHGNIEKLIGNVRTVISQIQTGITSAVDPELGRQISVDIDDLVLKQIPRNLKEKDTHLLASLHDMATRAKKIATDLKSSANNL